MKFRIGVLVLAFVWTIFPMGASALPLAGGPHDLTSKPGAPADICRECHVPHNAREKALYIRDLTPNTVDLNDNCYDCHDANRNVLSSPAQPPTWATSAPDAGYLNGSLHDWNRPGNTRPIATLGSCSPCHDIHLPDATTASYMGTWFTTSRLWTRDLSLDLAEYYQKRKLSQTSSTGGPNYLVGSTILCYDCHGGEARKAPAGDPFVPDDSDFSLTASPQDIAFGGDRDVKALSDGSNVGYYELPDGYEPDGFTHAAPSMSAVRDSPGISSNIPGGHFVQSWMGNSGTAQDDNYEVRDPDGTLLYRISIGDKLPCDLCHDPHAGYSGASASIGDDEVFFRRDIYVGENQVLNRNGDNQFNDLRASAASRKGTGTGRWMCIYCHGTSDWDGTQSPSTGVSPLVVNWGKQLTVFGIRIRTVSYPNGSSAFPPPNTVPDHFATATTACTGCHRHNNIAPSCGGCHGFPPTTGAHLAHSSTANGKPEFNCETCHGPNPGSATWHNESGASLYDANNPTHYNNITLINELTILQRGTEAAYYNSTWNRTGQPAPTVTRNAGWAFTCTNVQCHGMDPVTWTWKTTDTGTGIPSPPGGYKLCGGCHGATTDIDGDGNLDPDNDMDGTVDVSNFWSRGGTFYEATSTAANYEVPLSGFSRGGHGDTAIDNPSWATDTAPGESLPVACNRCHNTSAPHFTLDANNPYRIQSFVADAHTTAITKLCLTCHPADGTSFAFSAPPKHSNDHYLNRSGGPFQQPVLVTNPLAPVNLEGASTTGSPAYDPVGTTQSATRVVGVHIDRYVDHWQWWGTAATGNASDGVPFLPQGDSLAKNLTTNTTYNNDAGTVITCITCHNPHGSDLFVYGQTPGSGVNLIGIPANKMLRLRDQDDELCSACH